MKHIKKLLLAMGLMFAACGASANTEFLTISQINYNGDSNDLFFRTHAGKWGDPACPNANYVRIKPTVSGRQQILSIGLAAYMAGKKVQFWGQCSATDVGYYEAMYVVVSD